MEDTVKLTALIAGASVCYFAGRMVTLRKIKKTLPSVLLDTAEQMNIIENVMAAHGYVKVDQN